MRPAAIETPVTGKSKIQRRPESLSEVSKILREEGSNASYTNSGRHHRRESRVDNLEQEDRRNLVQDLKSSLLPVDEQGNIMPKTPEAALVAVQAYLLTTQPAPGE
jgi:hypothetical protein